jgi:hypothetical protein
MQENLATILVEKGVIKLGTELFSRCDALAMGGAPCNMDLPIKVRLIVINDNNIKFIGRYNNQNWIIHCDQILAVDGMDPERLASAFDLKINGSKKELGKKRGRKSKHQKEDNGTKFDSYAVCS